MPRRSLTIPRSGSSSRKRGERDVAIPASNSGGRVALDRVGWMRSSNTVTLVTRGESHVLNQTAIRKKRSMNLCRGILEVLQLCCIMMHRFLDHTGLQPDPGDDLVAVHGHGASEIGG